MTYTDFEIISKIKEWERRFGFVPTEDDWEKRWPGFPSRGAVNNHFGGWRKAMVIAGFTAERYKRKEIHNLKTVMIRKIIELGG